MIDLVGSAVLGLLDVFLFSGPNAHRRTYEAYVEAYRGVNGHASTHNLPALRERFKQHSAPGAYVAPDGEPLASWIASWCDGETPRSARRKARRYRPGGA